MSFQSPEPTALDPDGVDPLVGPGTALEELDEPTAAAAAALYNGAETERWLGWLNESGRLDHPWSPAAGESELIALWQVVLRAVEQGEFVGCEWAELAAHPPVPLWARVHPVRAQWFGVEGSRIVGALLAGVTSWMQHHWGGHWRAVPAIYDNPAAVAFAVPAGLGYQDEQLAVGVSSAINDMPGRRSPDRLLKWVQMHGPGTKPGDEPPEPEFYLDELSEEDNEDLEYGWSLGFCDWVAHREEDRVHKMVGLLKASPQIRDCIHENREQVFFNSDLGRDELDALIESLWATT
jgi:hypothetical protein